MIQDSRIKKQRILQECEDYLNSTPSRAAQKSGSVQERLLTELVEIVRLGEINEARLESISEDLVEEKKRLESYANQLALYLPRQIHDSIFSGKQSFEIKTQRKLLTVFFSDIQGFTKISSVIQPEVLTHYINQYFSEMSEIALRHGGTIDKFIGDAMMVFFGDPASRGPQEDALACVRMAYDMQKRLSQLHVQWEREGLQYPFITRIGINTGYCNVGNFGSHSRMAYTILGGEVNLAARIEGQCEPGGVLMTHETYAYVKNYVEVIEREPVSLKGITLPARTYGLVRMLEPSQSGQADLQVKLPGSKILIKPSNLSLPERLSIIARLRDAASVLEGQVAPENSCANYPNTPKADE